MFYICVCLSVCLSVRKIIDKDYTESYRRGFDGLAEGRSVAQKKQDFGGDPNLLQFVYTLCSELTKLSIWAWRKLTTSLEHSV